MIWDDPWVQLALQPGGTTLPPPLTQLPPELRFVCVQVGDLDLDRWIDLVGTRWTASELTIRLADAWIPCLFRGDDLVATCVFRPKPDMWILETLRAHKGYGTPLMRSAIPWIYRSTSSVLGIGYTWELSAPGIIAAWWRGWLGSATSIQYGWAWTTVGCSFCPSWSPIGNRLVLPTLIQDDGGSAVVSDSGLGDGWGYVSVFRGHPNWSAIAKKGGWKALWMRAHRGPKGWLWTGEFVVVGALNHRGPVPTEWITAEIAIA